MQLYCIFSNFHHLSVRGLCIRSSYFVATWVLLSPPKQMKPVPRTHVLSTCRSASFSKLRITVIEDRLSILMTICVVCFKPSLYDKQRWKGGAVYTQVNLLRKAPNLPNALDERNGVSKHASLTKGISHQSRNGNNSHSHFDRQQGKHEF